MNYLTNVKNVIKLSQQELQNIGKSSWHDQYKDSAWIFIGGLPYDLTEGDIICVFSQYGEVVNINLIRAKDTGKSKGFCFLCYEDQRSTILAVDNLNGIKILNRTIRVDHVQDYKVPKEDKKTTEETKKLYSEGCAPKTAPIVPNQELPDLQLRETLADQIDGDIKLPQRLPIYVNIKEEKFSDNETEVVVKKEKKKKSKRKSKNKSKESHKSSDESDLSSDSETNTKIKKESCREDRDRDHISDRTKEEKIKNKSRSDRSRSRDRDQKIYKYKKDVSPSIPKRWR